MKVCGFTFIRNAVKFDFPVVEAILSVLPVCDHFVVAVGKSDDETRKLIESIAPEKISVVDTVWDETLKDGGRVYADETNKALNAIPAEFNWCFYIQGDEVLHEKYLPVVQKAMEDNLERNEVEGLLFDYRHFYGSYNYVGDCRHWYRKEIRVIRNGKAIRSYKDAQGFRKAGEKLKVVQVPAEIYHYGWVRHPREMQQKVAAVKAFYDGISDEDARQKLAGQEFDYGAEYDALVRFEGTHPKIMQERIQRLNWDFQPQLNKINMKLKYRILYRIEKWFGVRLFEYRNYRLID